MFISEGVNTKETFADGTSAHGTSQPAINWHVFYGYPGQKPKAEYSIWSTTNNFGLVQSRDFSPTKNQSQSLEIHSPNPRQQPHVLQFENDWGTNSQSSNTQLLNFAIKEQGLVARSNQQKLSRRTEHKKSHLCCHRTRFARLNRGGWSDQTLPFKTLKRRKHIISRLQETSNLKRSS